MRLTKLNMFYSQSTKGDKNLFAVQRSQNGGQWRISFSGKEYEVIDDIEQYKKQLKVRIEKMLRDEQRNDHAILREKTGSFSKSHQIHSSLRKDTSYFILERCCR